MFATTARKAGLGIAVLVVAAALLAFGLTRTGETQTTGPAVTIDLWADTGTAAMPDGTNVPVWSYAKQDPAQGGSIGLPGPVLEVNQGDEVSVVLHNNLDRKTSLLLPGQDLSPDTDGVAAGDQKTYTFTAGKPGTYLYESGIDQEKQVQMGLYGALIVRPNAPSQAYDDPSTSYDKEAVLLLSEIDPAVHNDPDAANPLDYNPKYFLINGKAYPQTGNIAAAAGDKVLFRYLNAGFQDHTLQLLGMDQQVIAGDGYPLNSPRSSFTQLVAPGETYDLIGQVPNGAAGTKFPLYSRQFHLGSGASSPGGMTTFVEVQ